MKGDCFLKHEVKMLSKGAIFETGKTFVGHTEQYNPKADEGSGTVRTYYQDLVGETGIAT